jgi:amino-acid N-acetyltransferase
MIRPATSSDYPRICQLLQSESLPSIDLPNELPHFFVKTERNEIVGTIGLELYGGAALLRSMIVHPTYRNMGIASELIDELTHEAKKERVHHLFLITNTAEEFFRRKGFHKVDKKDVHEEVLQSQEFNGLCPASSAIMMKEI